jgi:hypothetical protein
MADKYYTWATIAEFNLLTEDFENFAPNVDEE